MAVLVFILMVLSVPSSAIAIVLALDGRKRREDAEGRIGRLGGE